MKIRYFFFLILLSGLSSNTIYPQSNEAGFALSFDGSDGYAEIPDSPELSGGAGKSITVEAWVHPTNVLKDRPVIQKWWDSQWKEWSLMVDGSNQHEVSVAIENNGDNFEYKAGSVSPGVWTHIAMTYDWATKYLRIYINGSEVGPGAIVNQGMPDTDAPVYIGEHYYNSNEKHYLGEIDEIRIWDFAKTDDELQVLMNKSLTGSESGLIAYWKFDEGSGLTIQDYSGNGHDGSLEPDQASAPVWLQSSAPLFSQEFLQVISPNGGETWVQGSQQPITWSSGGNITNVMIEFSDDAGSTWSTVTGSTANDGGYNWTLPVSLTNEGLIRISDVSNSTVSDTSDAAFSIVEAPPPALGFTDITLSAGTGGPAQTGGHGSLFADVNGDGLSDLYITMLYDVRMSDLFFRNIDGATFASEASLRGIDDFDGGSHGATFADLDNDGDFDLYNGTTGLDGAPEHNNIFENDGSGFFTDVTDSAGIALRQWPTRGVIAFDMDRDGDLDLFSVTNYQGSNDPPSERNEVYRNDGSLQFTEITSGALYTAPVGQGATDADYDGDGDIDVIAGNRTGDVNILNNDGLGNFTLISPGSIGISHQGREGATLGDVNNDGYLDVLLSDFDDGQNYAIGHLYLNNGDGTFTFKSTFTQTAGYMGEFGDLDNDGDLDVVFAGDDVCYLNDGAGNFSVGPAIPVNGIDDPRSIAMSDIDNDGDLDFAIGAKRSRNWLVRNDFNSGNWLKVNLISPTGQIGAFGAKVKIYPDGQAGGSLLSYREARSNNGYLGQSDPSLHFGLGNHSAVDVVVTFLDGTVVTQSGVSANQVITIDASSVGNQAPIIDSFNPTSGQPGTSVTILGHKFSPATDVFFNGVSASFNIISDTKISATVPAGATSGLLSVTNANGNGFSQNEFTVIGPPVISSFAPQSGALGAEVTISGANFQGATSVAFNGTTVTNFTIVSDSELKANVPSGATTGKISVTNSVGTAISSDDFVVVVGSGFALNFDGSDDFVEIPDNELLSGGPGKSITVEAWVKLESLTTSAPLVMKFLDSQDKDWGLRVDANGALQVAIESNGGNWEYLAGNVPVGAWTHVAFTFDNPTDAVKLYINGGEVGNGASFTKDMPNTNADVLFGRHNYNPEYLDGTLEEVRIWNFARSQSQIQNTMSQELTGNEAGLIGYWPLNEGSGQIAGDLVNGNDGQLGSSSGTDNSDPGWVNSTAPINGGGTTQYTLTVTTQGSGSVALNPSGGVYSEGAVVQLTANPASGWQFAGWSGDLSGNTNPENITMDSDKNVTATFTQLPPQQYTLTVTTQGSGAVALSPSGGIYNAGTVVQLTANPNSGWQFDGWSGDLTGSTNPATISMDSDKNVTATFSQSGGGTSTFTFNPTDDGQVKLTSPFNNYGNKSTTKVEASDFRSYFKFNVNELSGTVQSAILRLQVCPDPSDASDSGGSIYSVSNNFEGTTTPWVESTLTSGNAPDINGSPLSTLGPVSPNQIVDFDVTAAITGNGIVSFGIKSNSLDQVKYYTKEGLTPPELIIETDAGGSGNVPPIAVDDDTTTTEGVAVVIDVTANDSDSDGSIVVSTVTVITQPADGNTAVNTSTGTVTYTPNPGFVGVDTFTYTVKDDSGAVSNEATVIVTVNEFNEIPIAIDDSTATDEDIPVVIDVTANDSDPDGSLNKATVKVTNQPANGSTSVNPTTGSITYTPATDFFGTESFTYTIDDNEGATSNEAMVTIAVESINDAPVAVDDQASVAQNDSVVINVPDNDTDVDGVIDVTMVAIVQQPTSGTVTVNSTTGAVTYTPGSTFSNSDLFTYTVKDDSGAVSNEATVTVNEDGGGTNAVFQPIDDGQVKLTDPGSNYGNKGTMKVEANKFSSYLKFNVSGVNGAINNAKVRLQVTDGEFDASDSGGSIYSVSNNFEGTSTPWEEETLTSGNAPVISGSPLSTIGAVSQNQFVEFDVTAAVTGNGIYSFAIQSDSPDQVKYFTKEGGTPPELILSGGSGGNNPPVAVDDTASTDEDVSVVIDVTANDSDSDGSINVQSVTVLAQPQNGSTSVDNSTGKVTYTPDTDFFGSNSFTYTVQDNAGALSNVATVSVTARSVNDAPLAVDDAASTTEDTPVDIDVVDNDTDKDGEIDVTTVEIVTQPGNGTASVDGSTGVVTYTPNSGFTGSDAFQYMVKDDSAAVSNVATVDVTIDEAGGGTSVLNFIPTDDAFVKLTSGGENFGGHNSLKVEKNKFVAYLKFNVTGLTQNVLSARLHLYVADPSNVGGSIYSVSNNYAGTNTSWIEEQITASNAPAISGSALDVLGPVNTDEIVEFDVTPAVSSDGAYSFAINTTSLDMVKYSAKEGSNNPPKLVIEIGGTSPLAPTITSFNPTSGSSGDEVTISGTNFFGSGGGTIPPGTIRIMPLGNSITQGVHGSTDNAGYRNDLAELLDAQSISYDLVGTLDDGTGFDNDHEGHSGFRADEIFDNLNSYLNSNPPDWILLHIGTNDISQNQTPQSTVDEISDILDGIDQFNSTIMTILASIVPRKDSKDANTTTLNNLIFDLASEKQLSGLNVHYAPINEEFKSNPNWANEYYPIDDNVHPNDAGYAVMAGVWYDLIMELLTGAGSNIDVAFNGVLSNNVTIDSEIQIRADVPAGASTGPISVTTQYGTAESSSDFVVTGATVAALDFTYPKGGEKWTPGSTHTLMWNSTENVASVRLEYSGDNGRSWQTLAERIPNTGKFIWKTPDTAVEKVLLRISEANQANTSDLIAENITIARNENVDRIPNLAEMKAALFNAADVDADLRLRSDLDGNGEVDLADLLRFLDSNLDEKSLATAKATAIDAPANGFVKVTMPEIHGSVGDTVQVPVLVESDQPIRGFHLKLKFDSKKFTILQTPTHNGFNMLLDSYRTDNSIEILGYLKKQDSAVEVSGELLTLPVLLQNDSDGPVDVEIVEAAFATKSKQLLKTLTETASTSDSNVPDDFQLFQNYPNPFNITTQIKFDLPAKSKVRIHVYNLKGELVRTLLDEEMTAGQHNIEWDGKNNSGHIVATGAYFYRIKAGNWENTRRMTLIK